MKQTTLRVNTTTAKRINKLAKAERLTVAEYIDKYLFNYKLKL